MNVTLASSNPHKVEELGELLKGSLELKAAPEKLEVAETGTSFHENALIKAKAYYDKFQAPTLSDDSGLVLEAFPNKLGIYSARFAPEHEDYAGKCQAVLDMYQESQEENRKAYFVSVLCLYLSPDEIYYFEGRCQGLIGNEIVGKEGFGYDPIFMPINNEGQSFATDTTFKNQEGHRAKAIQALKDFLQQQ